MSITDFLEELDFYQLRLLNSQALPENSMLFANVQKGKPDNYEYFFKAFSIIE